MHIMNKVAIKQCCRNTRRATFFAKIFITKLHCRSYTIFRDLTRLCQNLNHYIYSFIHCNVSRFALSSCFKGMILKFQDYKKKQNLDHFIIKMNTLQIDWKLWYNVYYNLKFLCSGEIFYHFCGYGFEYLIYIYRHVN